MRKYQVNGPGVFTVSAGPTYGTAAPEPLSPEALKRAALRSKIRIALASVIACTGSMTLGFNFSYASPAIPNLNKPHVAPFHMSPVQQSWFISASAFTAILGAFLTGVLVDWLGRKLSLVLAAVPFVTGWLLIISAVNAYMMYAGRACIGFSAALTLSVVSIYIAEIAPANVRGLLMSFHEIFVNFGVLVVYVVGSYIRYNWLAVMCMFPPVILCCAMMPMPESPRFLLMKGRREEATEALVWLRGGKVNVDEEIAKIQATMESTSKKVPWSAYFRAPLAKRFFVSQMLFALQEFTGINVVRSYTVSIFQSAGSHMDPNTQTIIVGAMLLAGSLCCMLIIDRMPRRILLIGSSAAMAVSMAALGTFYYVRFRNPAFAADHLSWLPLTSLVLLVFSFPLGMGPMPIIMTNEMFPTRARGRASAMGIVTLCITGFITTKFFVSIRLIVGDYGNFWAGGAICLITALFAFFFVPETKGMSLEDLEKSLEAPKEVEEGPPKEPVE